MARNVAGVEECEGVITTLGPGGCIISRGPAVERLLDEMAREREACAASGHPHPSEFLRGLDPKIAYLRCPNCGAHYQRPKFPEELQAEEDARIYGSKAG